MLEAALPATIGGRYRPVRVLGRGSFGVVLLADDLELARPVAVKVLAPGVTSSALRERFRREAQVTAGLADPGIVKVYDQGTTPEGALFIVYELMEGGDLAKVLARPEPIPFARARAWIVPLARGLARAHAAGVLHRDLKPANIMIRGDGSAALSDFGLAGGRADFETLTATGVTVGTPYYFAPELWRGALHSPASDQFSLGLVAWEVTFHQRAFPKVPVEDLARGKGFDRRPEPAGAFPGVPPAWTAAILRCLALDPDDRWPDVAELVAALEETPLPGATDSRDTLPLPLPAPSPMYVPGPARRGAPWAAMVAGFAAVAALGALGTWLHPRPAALPPGPSPPAESAEAAAILDRSLAQLAGALGLGAGGFPRARPLHPDPVPTRAWLPDLLEARFPAVWRRHVQALRAWLATGPDLAAPGPADRFEAAALRPVVGLMAVAYEVGSALDLAPYSLLAGESRLLDQEFGVLQVRWPALDQELRRSALDLVEGDPPGGPAGAHPMLALRLTILSTAESAATGPAVREARAALEAPADRWSPWLCDALLLASYATFLESALPCGEREAALATVATRAPAAGPDAAWYRARLLVEEVRRVRICAAGPEAVDRALGRLEAGPAGPGVRLGLGEAAALVRSTAVGFRPAGPELAARGERIARLLAVSRE